MQQHDTRSTQQDKTGVSCFYLVAKAAPVFVLLLAIAKTYQHARFYSGVELVTLLIIPLPLSVFGAVVAIATLKKHVFISLFSLLFASICASLI